MNARRQAILAQRAKALAKVHELRSVRLRGNEIVIVESGGLRLGIPIASLREIVPCGDVTELPGVPSWMLGIVQLRGELLCVVDVGRWWNLPGATKHAYVVLIEGPQGFLGVVAESVVEVRGIEADDVAADISEESIARRRFVKLVTRDLVHVLDIARLTAQEELVIVDTLSNTAGANGE